MCFFLWGSGATLVCMRSSTGTTAVTRCIAKHHDQRLIVYLVQDIIDAPTGGIGYLPKESEGAMGVFVMAP